MYTQVVNFAPKGEKGEGRFIPIIEAGDTNSTLAQWIQIPKGPFVIPPEKTKEISFFADIPKDAPPGGHFAAILIGTQPPKGDGSFLVQTSQVVTSLFFVRIEGDVVESGNIREFSMADSFLDKPEAEFVLRFENKGNVLLQPRGQIVITNMWGSERGVIPINQQTHFGNVLPESIREFRFKWKGEQSITDIGRYTAVATLDYGEKGIQTTSSITYFWVIPVKATLFTLAAIIGFVLFVAWVIRLYIRRMLALAGVDVEKVEFIQATVKLKRSGDIKLASYSNVTAPLKSGALDLRSRLHNAHKFIDLLQTLFAFAKNYKIFFVAVIVFIGVIIGSVLYISDASKKGRSYEVTIEHDGGDMVVNSEEILRDKFQGGTAAMASSTQTFLIEIINASGQTGLAAQNALILEHDGYEVSVLNIGAELRKDSVILYSPGLEEEALAVSSALGGVLLSTLPEDTNVSTEQEDPTIRIIVGSDRSQ